MDNGASSYRRYLDGDDNGLVEIIKEYKDGLTLYINGFVNNIFIAEDLMEETFFKLATKRPRFSGKSSFKTWLYAIARNIAIDYLRHNSKFISDSVDELSNFLAEETLTLFSADLILGILKTPLNLIVFHLTVIFYHAF